MKFSNFIPFITLALPAFATAIAKPASVNMVESVAAGKNCDLSCALFYHNCLAKGKENNDCAMALCDSNLGFQCRGCTVCKYHTDAEAFEAVEPVQARQFIDPIESPIVILSSTASNPPGQTPLPPIRCVTIGMTSTCSGVDAALTSWVDPLPAYATPSISIVTTPLVNPVQGRDEHIGSPLVSTISTDEHRFSILPVTTDEQRFSILPISIPTSTTLETLRTPAVPSNLVNNGEPLYTGKPKPPYVPFW